MVLMAPQQKPHRSKQDYATPDDFIQAVKKRLNIEEFCIDLAADESNSKAQRYYNEKDNSLSKDWNSWKGKGWCWLNPPFTIISVWAQKCSTSTANVSLLVPASVGSNWFRDYVDGKALVLLLGPRLSFDGKGPYPKDCMLCLYGPKIKPGYEVWQWKESNELS